MKTFQTEQNCHWETVHVLLGKLGHRGSIQLSNDQQDTNAGGVLLFAYQPSDTRLWHPTYLNLVNE